MYRPTARALAALELLQSRGTVTAAELARRLEVHPRTAKRYVEILQDMGIPVMGVRGRYGGYVLGPGARMPPLMLTDDEAQALTAGLLAARRLGLAAAAPAVEGALAKIERVLPEPVRRGVQALEEVLVMDVGREGRQDGAPKATLVAVLAEGVRDRRRVRLSYRGSDGVGTAREVDPYGLVHRGGRWYLAGHCRLRGDQRLFRLDRIEGAVLSEVTFVRPTGYDPLAEVERALAAQPTSWRYEVLLRTTMERARARVSRVAGTLEATAEGVLLRGGADDLDRAAHYLAGLGLPLEVRAPQELRHALRRYVVRLQAWANDHRDT